MIRGLAWDDQPAEDNYIQRLKDALHRKGVELTIYKNEDQFIEKAIDGKWDFLITDLYKSTRYDATREDDVAHGKQVGVELLSAIQNTSIDCPIYCITHAPEEAAAHLKSFPRVLIRPKSLYPNWVADDIVRELTRLGRLLNRSKVFLIYAIGCDAYRPIKSWLTNAGLTVERVGPGSLTEHISKGLVSTMSICGAIVAICTPDDKLAGDGPYQPRQNVLLEIGMSLALFRGHERLIILQQRRAANQNGFEAELPSDLAGILTIPFAETTDEAIPTLEHALKARGLLLRAKPHA